MSAGTFETTVSTAIYSSYHGDRQLISLCLIGHWTKEEEDRLTDIVMDMTVKQGKDTDNDVFWGRVSELMGNTRGRQQCRIKWSVHITWSSRVSLPYPTVLFRIDSLSKDFKTDGTKTRWSQQDAYILVHKFVNSC